MYSVNVDKLVKTSETQAIAVGERGRDMSCCAAVIPLSKV